MELTGIVQRIVVAIITAIIVGFLVWLVGWLIVTFLGINSGIIALGTLLENISYFVGVIAGFLAFFSGKTFLPRV